MDEVVVYRLQFPGNKSYIGVTKHLKLRLKQHHDQNTQLVGSAVRKYGMENIIVSVLCRTDRDTAYLIEKRAIERLKALVPQGYNVDSGGPGCPAPIEATRKKMSESRKGSRNGMFGRKHTDESKLKMSEAQRARPRAPHSEETKRKISQSNIETKQKTRQARLRRRAQPGQHVNNEVV